MQSTRYFCQNLKIIFLLNNFKKITRISNFMKIRPVEAGFFPYGQIDRQADITKLVVAFRNFCKRS